MLTSANGDVALVLNATANVIWEFCDGTRNSEEIATFICDTLPDAETRQVREDVAELLGRLLEAGLIEDMDRCGAPRSDR